MRRVFQQLVHRREHAGEACPGPRHPLAGRLDLTVLGDTVTLKGKREDDYKESDRFYRKERVSGEFTRTLTLPDPVDPKTVKAQYQNGVLKVTLNKAEAAKAKKIKIKS